MRWPSLCGHRPPAAAIARVEVRAEANHWVLADQQDTTEDLLQDFLAS